MTKRKRSKSKSTDRKQSSDRDRGRSESRSQKIERRESSERKKRKHRKEHKRRRSSSSSSTSSSSSSSSSSRERRRKEKKKKKKKKKKKLKEKLKKKAEEKSCNPSLVTVAASCSVQDDKHEAESRASAMRPMTKEEWEKKQSTIRRVYDPVTGRNRLVRGDGEIIEEIVSKDRHKEINQQSTRGDAAYYAMKMGTLDK